MTTTGAQYSSLPMREVLKTRLTDKYPKTYGIIMYHKESDSWLMVRRKHTIQYTNILKARCPISDIPSYILDHLTEEEISHLWSLVISLKDSSTLYDIPEKYTQIIIETYGQKMRHMRDGWQFMYHALPLIERVITVRRGLDRPYPSLFYEWPKGHKEKEESPFTSAVREFMEESSLTSLDPNTLILPTVIEQKTTLPKAVLTTDYWVFVSPTLLPLSQPSKDDVEVSERAWIPTKECLATLPSTKIETLTKALSLIG
jgi:8-oxo-dGTP pyrophosphatase MutT (NUDIX family)